MLSNSARTETAVYKHWSAIPATFTDKASWCVSSADKAPLLPASDTFRNASPVADSYLTFVDACAIASANNMLIGFVIQDGMNLTCVDCDIKDISSTTPHGMPFAEHLWTTQTQCQNFESILDIGDSYAELSKSGKGLHIWFEGDIGAGRRGKSMEVYSRERYIIFTGNVVAKVSYKNIFGSIVPHVIESVIKPVKENNVFVNTIADDIKADSNANHIELTDVEPEISDAELWRRATHADNAEKFENLCNGLWQQYNHPSQSEADLALMSMFSFYSKSNEQCRRLFRKTVLGQRAKAQKNDLYLNYTLRLVRTRQAKAEKLNAAIDVQSMFATQKVRNEINSKEKVENLKSIDFPPDFAGDIAKFIYDQAYRQVPEVAIAATFGFLSGILGKSYATPTLAGLNLYTVLVARSGIGKDAMHTGINALVDHVKKLNPSCNIQNRISHDLPVSAPALVKLAQSKGSMVTVHSEFGHVIKALIGTNNSNDKALLSQFTRLYSQSGKGGKSSGLKYSDSDNDIKSSNVAYSLLGETTPSTLQPALTLEVMADGTLSRFLIIEYTGDLLPENENRIGPTKPMIDHLSKLVDFAHRLQTTNPHQEVKYFDHTESIFSAFSLECDQNTRAAGDDEATRQVWTRASLKALKIASILAVANDYVNPVIETRHADYAIMLVRRNIDLFLRKLESGDIGASDDAREKKIMDVCKKVVTGHYQTVSRKYWNQGIIPRKAFADNIKGDAFTKHPRGKSNAIDLTIKSLIDNGRLKEIKDCNDLGGGRYFKLLDAD